MSLTLLTHPSLQHDGLKAFWLTQKYANQNMLANWPDKQSQSFEPSKKGHAKSSSGVDDMDVLNAAFKKAKLDLKPTPFTPFDPYATPSASSSSPQSSPVSSPSSSSAPLPSFPVTTFSLLIFHNHEDGVPICPKCTTTGECIIATYRRGPTVRTVISHLEIGSAQQHRLFDAFWRFTLPEAFRVLEHGDVDFTDKSVRVHMRNVISRTIGLMGPKSVVQAHLDRLAKHMPLLVSLQMRFMNVKVYTLKKGALVDTPLHDGEVYSLATMADAETIVDWSLLFESECWNMPVEKILPFRELFIPAIRNAIESCKVHLLRINHQPISMHWCSGINLNEGFARSAFVFTPKDHRKKGYARRLHCAMAREYFQRPQINELSLTADVLNPISQSLYLSLGYQTIPGLEDTHIVSFLPYVFSFRAMEIPDPIPAPNPLPLIHDED